MRLNITLSDDLVKQIDERAKSMFVSRSAYIAMALTQKMQADDAMANLPVMASAFHDALELSRMRNNSLGVGDEDKGKKGGR